MPGPAQILLNFNAYIWINPIIKFIGLPLTWIKTNLRIEWMLFAKNNNKVIMKVEAYLSWESFWYNLSLLRLIPRLGVKNEYKINNLILLPSEPCWSRMLYHIYIMSAINLPNIFNYRAQKSPSVLGNVLPSPTKWLTACKISRKNIHFFIQNIPKSKLSPGENKYPRGG